MHISLAPILLATTELGFLFTLAWRFGSQARGSTDMGPVYVFFLWVTAYGIVTSVLGARDVYISDDMLRTLPGFWLQMVTVGAIVIPVIVSRTVRNGLRKIVDTRMVKKLRRSHRSRILTVHPFFPANESI